MSALAFATVAAGLMLASTEARAHGADGDVVLHVGYAYENCYIDLHEELSGSDFKVFSRQFADAGAFLAMSGAQPIGPRHVAFGFNYKQTFLDDATPQWNHTFTHPGDDHWLGRPALPTVQGRVGLTERLDGELMVTGDPTANWAIAGLAARRLMLVESEHLPVSLAARTTYVHLFGAEELDHESGSAELLASRAFGWLSPFVGAGVVAALAVERTDELDLGSALAFSGRATVGAEATLGHVRISGQGTLASVPSLALMVGGTL